MAGFRLVSDIHIEFFYKRKEKFDLPILPTDSEDILVLAGDIGLAKRPTTTYESYLRAWAPRFKSIIYIMGNHEFYGTSINRGLNKIKEKLADLDNVHVVNQEVIRFDMDEMKISFVCATLWSSFYNGNPISMLDCNFLMADYQKIRIGTINNPYKRKFTPRDAYYMFIRDKEFIEKEVPVEIKQGRKVVVVTHNSPSFKSTPKYLKNSKTSGAYSSELYDVVYDLDADVWCHGHLHNSSAYEINETAVLCNPFGYYKVEQNPDFNPTFRVEFKIINIKRENQIV